MREGWTYSYTQLSLFRLCPLRYYERYVRTERVKETPSIPMAYSTHLVHKPFQLAHQGQEIPWSELWQAFIQEAALDPDFSDPRFNLYTARQVQEAYRCAPIKGEVEFVEERLYGLIGGRQYVSKPDLVVHDGEYRWTLDWKFKSSYRMDALRPFDDQLVGQAVTHGTDGFLRYVFHYPSKATKPKPILEGHLLKPAIVERWKRNTLATIEQIERSIETGHWDQHEQSCMAYGRECERLAQCESGL